MKNIESLLGVAAIGAGASIVGALGAGVYEGVTGERVFENTNMLATTAVTGYGAQLFGVLAARESWGPHIRAAQDKYIALPIVPAITAACYGAGYGIGYLLK
ncbi:MAG: hypothetical protein A2912_03905 [Candidatus Buchananbacteria bacterium RIFCSPLOWO2_01_FULL_40_23b]|uniref:Uncharacterized protein n=1 Tax=Candidatus Buchananbacteria bacterium RIFCSPLOWO2_01_FULL_40_23b TaxID=1797544 RepID=A0A1G1YNA9_9BACT|nr:MAG: hypothetical protein A2912_03905 [Candidatus Buchananbacteria bacterium RIFCSPLOWO2_01_FULL_40_23b]